MCDVCNAGTVWYGHPATWRTAACLVHNTNRSVAELGSEYSEVHPIVLAGLECLQAVVGGGVYLSR